MNPNIAVALNSEVIVPSGGRKKFRGEIQSTLSPLITEGCWEKTKAGKESKIECHFLTRKRTSTKEKVKDLLKDCYKLCYHEVERSNCLIL